LGRLSREDDRKFHRVIGEAASRHETWSSRRGKICPRDGLFGDISDLAFRPIGLEPENVLG
jgi:hypothetical protein